MSLLDSLASLAQSLSLSSPSSVIRDRTEPITAYHQRLSNLYQKSRYNNVDALNSIINTLTTHAIADKTPSPPIIDGIFQLIRTLLLQNDLAFDLPELDQRLIREDNYALPLRRELEAKEPYLIHEDPIFETFTTTLYELTSNILIEHLPPAALNDEPSIFSIPIITAFKDPTALLKSILSAMFTTRDGTTGLAFAHTRNQLFENLCHIFKVSPQETLRNTNKINLPDKITAQELLPYFAHTPFADLLSIHIPFSIPPLWNNHAILLAPSGHGKTMALGAILAGFLQQKDPPAIFVIEPHNDLISQLEHLEIFGPNGHLSDRLTILDPADIPSLNFLDVGNELSSSVMESFTYLMSSLSSDLTKKQETAAAYILMLTQKIPGANIETLRQIMEERAKSVNTSQFAYAINQLEPFAQDFFHNQFYSANMGETRQQVAARLYTLLTNDTFRKMFSTTKNNFSPTDIMEHKGICLINANRDLLSDLGASVFGRWALTQIMLAGLKRPPNKRHLCLVVLDEAHLYFDASTERILSELRKFGVGLCASTQYLARIEDNIKAAIYGNTAIKIAGPVSHNDAVSLSREMFCDVKFIRSMKSVDFSHAEFALYTRNLQQAMQLTIPFGILLNAPKMTTQEHQQFRAKNREHFTSKEPPRSEAARPLQADTSITHKGPSAPEPLHVIPDTSPKGDTTTIPPTKPTPGKIIPEKFDGTF